MAKFERVNIEISNVCNLKCSFCPEPGRPKAFMTVRQFEKALTAVKPHTKQVCLHLLGEPLAHPDFSKIVEICENHELPIEVVTNGILVKNVGPPSNQTIELQDKKNNSKSDVIGDVKTLSLLNRTVRQVNISLHSFFDNFPDRSPNTYLENVFSFVDLAMKSRPDLYINFRLWNLKPDQSHSEDRKHRNQEMLAKIESRYGKIDFSRLNVKNWKSINITGRLYMHFDSEFIWPSLSDDIRSTEGYCQALRSHIGILADGTVVPCCLDRDGIMNLGNVFQMDESQFRTDILESPRALAMKSGFSSGQLVEDLCKRCQYIERFK